MMLIACFSPPVGAHSQEIAADWIVMPRSRSWIMKSVVVLPSWTSPCLWILPV